MRRMSVLSFVASALVVTASAKAAEPPFFQAKVRIPFALQSGSTFVKPGEYSVVIKPGKNFPILDLQSTGGGKVLQINSEGSGFVPREERNFKEEFRLKIARMPDEHSPGKSWIVFYLDNRIGFRRLTFRVPEGGGATR